jgi:DNA (cytosine-5)-methyltransferase 1
MVAFYNEIDPFAAAWLRELIKEGHIPPGDVDERSIEDIYPADLKGYTQCHFFAGIGGWPYALRLAGFPDDRQVWTGSCPCQPFSSAGKGAGFDDERHLWPAFHWLIQQGKPQLVFGEQVSSKDGLAWLDLLQSDLEGTGFASWAVDLCAAGVSAPHIRQRLYWGAERMVDGEQPGLEGHAGNGDDSHEPGRLNENQNRPASEAGRIGGVANANSEGNSRRRIQGSGKSSGESAWSSRERPEGLRENRWADAAHSLWGNPDWLFCRDGKWRPTQPGIFPLADRIAGRVGLLRGYGNCIVPAVAAAFIGASLE